MLGVLLFEELQEYSGTVSFCRRGQNGFAKTYHCQYEEDCNKVRIHMIESSGYDAGGDTVVSFVFVEEL
jgi:hypothetical protein